MPTYIRAITSRQLRHTASRCRSHRDDARANAARPECVSVPLPQPAPPPLTFEDLGLMGHEYKCEGRDWVRCVDAEEFADYVQQLGQSRNWFHDTTTRHGRPCRMLRRVGTPVEIHTTTFSPWLNAWIRAELQAGRDPRPTLAEIRNRWLAFVTTRFAGVRHVLGYSLHADTGNLHFDLVLTRQDGRGGRIGPTALRLVGPWACGTARQRDVGATISAEKSRRLGVMITRFRARYGAAAVPLDVELNRALDAAADAVLGDQLAPFKREYAASVPALEQMHAAAIRSAADALREKADTIAPSPAPTPAPTITHTATPTR